LRALEQEDSSVPTNKQRRDAQRRHLERQLQRRRERDVRRRKTNLVLSIVGTLVLVAAIVLSIVLIGGSDSKKTPAANSSLSLSSSAISPPPTTSAPPSTSYAAATGKTVEFDKVTVKGATDLSGYPTVTAKSTTAPTKIEVKDLVVGTGKAATPKSTVTVQYTGVLYANGQKFDASWDRGAPAQFSLERVVPGFTQGIGGTTGVAPMKEGGRRIMILPAALGYGAAGQPPTIPGNAALVFVVDLKSVDS
jgi:FKBP-type peptidyl-prolyl cis-trans isomerase